MTSELKYYASIGQQSVGIRLISSQRLEIDGTELDFDFRPLNGRSYSLILGTRSFVVTVVENDESVLLQKRETASFRGTTEVLSIKGKEYSVLIDDDHSLLLKKFAAKPHIGSGDHVVKAPMPGLISRLEVQVGEQVVKGQGLLVLEAMKMENEIRASGRGRVESILVKPGMAVEKDQQLVTIKELQF